MRGLGSFAAILVAALTGMFVYKFYFSAGSSTAAISNPTQTIDSVGVKNDLLAIGQAERVYQVEHSSYASLDELTASGAMSMKKTGRDGYAYDVSTSADGFVATAQCPAATSPGCTSFSVDESMTVKSTP